MLPLHQGYGLSELSTSLWSGLCELRLNLIFSCWNHLLSRFRRLRVGSRRLLDHEPKLVLNHSNVFLRIQFSVCDSSRSHTRAQRNRPVHYCEGASRLFFCSRKSRTDNKKAWAFRPRLANEKRLYVRSHLGYIYLSRLLSTVRDRVSRSVSRRTCDSRNLNVYMI